MRAIDPSKNQPNRLRIDRAREFHKFGRDVPNQWLISTQVLGLSPYKYGHASFGPPPGARPPHVAEASAPDAYRGPGLEAAVASAEAACDDLAARGHSVGAFFVESGMSVAGVVVAPPTYMARVYAAVRSRGGVCVADEVQTGLGRLGERFWWAFEEHGVVPDAVTVGKPFGNGFPLAAVVASRELSDAFAAGPEYFNTFGGNPVAWYAVPGLGPRDEQIELLLVCH